MSEETKKAPAIRFQGFTDDWEQRKLGEITESYSGGTPSVANHSYYGGSIPFIRSAEINSKNTELYLTEEGLNNSSAKLVEEGDILYALYGATSGEVGISQINGAINQAILAIKPKIEYDSNFIMQWLRRQKNSIISTYLQGGQGNLSGGIVKDLTLYAPTEYEEQTKIGSFFKQLDNTIALHQRKLDLLEQLKQTFLQVMFPQGEQKNTLFRFAGFSEPWEQRKIGEFLKESRIPGTDGSVAKKLTVKLWRKGVIPKEESYQGSPATNYFIRKSGQFIYGKLDFLNQAFGIVPDHLDGYESTLDSPAFDIFPIMNSIFFLEYVSRKEFYLYQGTLANGSRKAKRIHTETFFEMPINVPPYEEQNKIGNFLNQLDDTIDLQQQKVAHLKSLKSTLLNKMFT